MVELPFPRWIGSQFGYRAANIHVKPYRFYIPLPPRWSNPVRRYTEVMTRHLRKLEKRLYDDMLRHLKQTDQEYPWPWGDYVYYSRTVEGKVCTYRKA